MLEYHMCCQEGGADLEEAQRTQEGKGEARDSSPLSPRKLRIALHLTCVPRAHEKAAQ